LQENKGAVLINQTNKIQSTNKTPTWGKTRTNTNKENH